MHDTTLQLGKYAKDPRFEIVQVGGRDAVRTDEYTIVQGDTLFELWRRDDPTAIFPHHTEKTLGKALIFVLGDPQKVGPVGMSEWLHTDGRIYLHDPATTGMRAALSLRVGDIVDFPHIEAFEVKGPAAPRTDDIGRWVMAYPVRHLRGRTTWFPVRDGDMVPVRFAR